MFRMEKRNGKPIEIILKFGNLLMIESLFLNTYLFLLPFNKFFRHKRIWCFVKLDQVLIFWRNNFFRKIIMVLFSVSKNRKYWWCGSYVVFVIERCYLFLPIWFLSKIYLFWICLAYSHGFLIFGRYYYFLP